MAVSPEVVDLEEGTGRGTGWEECGRKCIDPERAKTRRAQDDISEELHLQLKRVAAHGDGVELLVGGGGGAGGVVVVVADETLADPVEAAETGLFRRRPDLVLALHGGDVVSRRDLI